MYLFVGGRDWKEMGRKGIECSELNELWGHLIKPKAVGATEAGLVVVQEEV